MTLPAALRAEWLKATTIWSPRLCLAAFVLAVAGVGTAAVAAVGVAQAHQDGPRFDPSVLAFYGLNFGHVAVIVFAVLITSGEYTRRTIHASLAAVPRRGVFLAAKLTVGTGLVLPTAAVTALLSLMATQAFMGRYAVSLETPGMVRATIAAALYPTLLAVVCMGVGVVLRDQTAALSLLVPFFFLVSPVLELIPGLRRAALFLPDRAGQVAIRLHGRPTDVFGPVVGLVILAAWAAAAVLGAWLLLHRRDA
jgi:ABC-2 type transport system permease protein